MTVQVPQQQVLSEHGFTLQPVHIVQGGTAQEQGIVASQVRLLRGLAALMLLGKTREIFFFWKVKYFVMQVFSTVHDLAAM